MNPTKVISFGAAAELAGVKPPALWRALREGRLRAPATLAIGGRLIHLVSLHDVLRAYDLLPLSVANEKRLAAWEHWAPTIIAATGEGRFLLLDNSAPLLHSHHEGIL